MLTTKNVDRTKLPEMMLQYVTVKDQYPNDIVFFRVGDFFESYFEDAFTFVNICGVTLTAKRIGESDGKKVKDNKKEIKNLDAKKDEQHKIDEIMNSKVLIPMAGVPHKSLGSYVNQLVYAGKRVVKVEQMEDPKSVKGRNIKREVVAIMSNMSKDGEFLTEYLNNFICVIYKEQNNYSLCFSDISTSDVYLTTVNSLENVYNEISRYKPSEILVNQEMADLLGTDIEAKLKLRIMLTVDNNMFDTSNYKEQIVDCFKIKGIDDLKYNTIYELKCLNSLINYIDFTQKLNFNFGKLPIFYESNNYMVIDMYSRSNLELTENIVDKTRKGTLFSILDYCKTNMGSRLLKQWIDKPLQNRTKIESRLDGVNELVNNPKLLENIQNSMIGILDIQRIMGRLKLNRSIPRDLINLCNSLEKLPDIKDYLKELDSGILKGIYRNFEVFDDLVFLIKNSILEDPVSDIKDGLVIKLGYNKELDTARDMVENSNKYLYELEEKEKEKTGIKNLKIVIKNGKCLIDVSTANKENKQKIPSNYIIYRNLKGSDRYITEETEKLEKQLFSAMERSKAIEIDLYEEIKVTILERFQEISILCDNLSILDVLCSFSYSAIKNDYTCPKLNSEGILSIVNGRHPVVEQSQDIFISNDTNMDLENNQFLLITGPNMAGKSTYMRQIALICIMAHIGSFVPAEKSNICIIDKIFTRIGASDDISSGRSTYMVEMTEVKNILDNATKKSLVLLDEVGRGTSTSDGLAIARSVSEYIYQNIGCKTLFATHYHELISLEENYKGVQNYHMAVNKENGNLVFIRKLEKGGLSESYGIDVAKLAGLPNSVIERAWNILDLIDNRNKEKLSTLKVENEEDNKILDYLRNLNKSDITPSFAYKILYELIELL